MSGSRIDQGTLHPIGRSPNGSDRHRSLVENATTPGEVILEGRRYRLVPLEANEPLPKKGSAVTQLTGRELQIVALVAAGRVNKQIGSDLRISEWTVSTHLRRIFAKLGVDTRAAMVSKCADWLRSRDR